KNTRKAQPSREKEARKKSRRLGHARRSATRPACIGEAALDDGSVPRPGYGRPSTRNRTSIPLDTDVDPPGYASPSTRKHARIHGRRGVHTPGYGHRSPGCASPSTRKDGPYPPGEGRG